jgi:hypothetical protein
MKIKNEWIFNGLHVIVWIIFIALLVEAGTIAFQFIFTLIKPSIAGHLYNQVDLSKLYNQSLYVFSGLYISGILIACNKAFLFYLTIKLMQQLDMQNPFQQQTAIQIKKISQTAVVIGFVSLFVKETAQQLDKKGFAVEGMNKFWSNSEGYLLMAAVVYILSVIFTRGVNLQKENDLTI